MELTITVIKTMVFNGHYGNTTMVLMKDANSNIYKWMSSNASADVKEGATLTMKATIKDHAVYNEAKQTLLTRCKVIEAV